MSKLSFRQIEAVVLVLLVSIVAVAVGVMRSGATLAPPGFSSISNQGGAPLAIDPKAEPLVRAAISKGLVVTPIRSMGAVRGTTFYRVGASGCYASGPSVGSERLATLFCPESFPSKIQPVVVSMLKQGDSPDQQGRIARVQGIGADAIAAVALQDAAGNVVAKTTVVNNLFRIDAIPSTSVAFVALDAAGNVVQRTDLP